MPHWIPSDHRLFSAQGLKSEFPSWHQAQAAPRAQAVVTLESWTRGRGDLKDESGLTGILPFQMIPLYNIEAPEPSKDR